MEKKRISVIAVAAAAGVICLLVYLRALSCGFVTMDDPDYVLNNPLIRSLDGDFFASAFGQAHVGWWMPLTWLSLAIDYQFWGVDPVGYHLTNIVLHSVNAGLVVLVADRLLQRGSGSGDREKRPNVSYAMLLLAGLFWGIHPLRVESVAWVTERKDVLNGLFTLGAILSYLRYAEGKEEGKEEGKGGAGGYALSLGLFACSLMAKSVSVVLPLLLVVADWYPLGRLRQGRIKPLLVEKIPFFILSAAMAMATIHFTAESSYLVSSEMFPFSQRLVVSGNALFEYCRLLLFPAGIIPFYVIPDPIPLSYTVTSLAILVLCVVIFVNRKHRWLPATALGFVIPLLPALAFLQNGDQSYAARFTYLPSLAPSIAAAAFLTAGCRRLADAGRRSGAYAVAAVVAVVLLLYGATTVRLIADWKDTGALWSRVIDREPSAIVYKERGIFYYSVKNYPAAIDDFSAALKMAPEAWRPYRYNLFAYRGESLRGAGRFAEAVGDFSAAIAQYPQPAYYHLRGLALEKLGRVREAAEDFHSAGPDPGALGWYWVPAGE